MKTVTYSVYLVYSNCRYNRTITTTFPQLVRDAFDMAILDPNFHCAFLYADGQYVPDLADIEATQSAAVSSTDILAVEVPESEAVHSSGVTEADVMDWIEHQKLDYKIVKKE